METVIAQPALNFGSERHDVADLVLVGLLTGQWQALEALTARGLALEAERSELVSAEELDRELAVFRYQRRLIAAAELHEWMSERFLYLVDLRAVMRRRLLRERCEGAECLPADANRVASVMRAEAMCAGALAQFADELRAWHAASDGLAEAEATVPSDPGSAPDPAKVAEVVATALGDAASGLGALDPTELQHRVVRLSELQATYERFRATAVADASVQARLAERRLQWTIVTGSELSFELEGAARETRLRVVHDGIGLAQVAGALGLEPTRRELELGRAPAHLGSELLVARHGDLIGPWREDERWKVLEIDGRVEPASLDDGRSRAREELLSELVERFSAGKVGVHAAF